MVLLVLAFFITVFSIITGSYINDTENIKVGEVAGRRYVSPITTENHLATQKLKEEALNKVEPLYKHDLEVKRNVINEADGFFADFNNALKKAEEAVSENDETGVSEPSFTIDAVFKIPVAVSEEQARSYYELTEMGKAQLAEETKGIINKAFDERITEETLSRVKISAKENAANTVWQKPLRDLIDDVVTAVLEPDFIIDAAAMEAAREQNVSEIQPVMVYKDQKIIDEGEVVTEEVFKLLTELGLINNTYVGSVIPFAGSIFIVLMIFMAVFFYMKTQKQKILKDKAKTLVLFSVYILHVLAISIMANMESYSLIPISIFAMLISILIKPQIALVLNAFVAISGLFIFNGQGDFLVYSLVTGSFAALLVQYTNRRSRIVIVSAGMGIIHGIAYVGVNLFFFKNFSQTIMNEAIYSFFVGFCSVLIVMGSPPLWEAVFGINTQYRLLDLLNHDNELMRRLMAETPGTYHHSLIVANLAETAAYEIFADGVLARAGAYYHDIGKLKKPQYFSENQFGENVHENLDPYISSKMIVEHVADGLELAREHKIPKVVMDIIEQHHGNTLVKYFYFKSAKSKPDVEIDEKDFRYKGPIPQSKEAAIVMLADTVEAAVRSYTATEHTADEIPSLIDELFKDKLTDGQLNECRLDLSELETIKKSFLRVFNGMYHGRIAYPKTEEIEKTREDQQNKKQEDLK